MFKIEIDRDEAPPGQRGSGGYLAITDRSRRSSDQVWVQTCFDVCIQAAAQRRRARIVAIEPVGVGRPAHPAIGDRDALHFGDARNARRRIAAECLGRSSNVVRQRLGSRRLRPPWRRRRHEGRIGWQASPSSTMRAAAPAIVARAIVDRPDAHAVHRLEHALQVAVEARERRK